MLPKYLPLWDKGKEQKAGFDAHQSATQGAGEALAAAFPGTMKPWGDDSYYIGKPGTTGPNGVAKVSGDKIDLELRNLSVRQAIDTIKALRLR